MTDHLITREIGIDAGHRVTYHGSKCRNIHGHRYTIQATCIGPLAESGPEQGMILDFSFLKEEMMAEIDAPCDHGLILWEKDAFLKILVDYDGKLYITSFVPTAENLARHWFDRLSPRVTARSQGRARLKRVRVLETPNCWADYEEQETA